MNAKRPDWDAIAEGKPADVRADAEVQRVYPGEAE